MLVCPYPNICRNYRETQRVKNLIPLMLCTAATLLATFDSLGKSRATVGKVQPL